MVILSHDGVLESYYEMCMSIPAFVLISQHVCSSTFHVCVNYSVHDMLSRVVHLVASIKCLSAACSLDLYFTN